MESNDLAIMNRALMMLAEKHELVAHGCLEIAEDVANTGIAVKLKTDDGRKWRLLPWRVERRFCELKNIIAGRTLEDVSTLRFSVFTAGTPLEWVMYREFDLCEWLGDVPVKSLFAVQNGSVSVNLIVELANQIICSIECGNKLPVGTGPIDRHEIIARRGIASDRVVDTQVPQASIYLFANGVEKRFMDTDAELFGLSAETLGLVRSALAVLKDPETGTLWLRQHERLSRQIAATAQTGKTGQPVLFQEKK
ncbi:MAG: hypothetical protein WC975_08810 [Phycisphaerae bacterium]